MTDLSLRIHSMERAERKRASFHIYYSRNGKRLFDPVWIEDEEKAIQHMRAIAKEAFPRSKIEILKAVRLSPISF